MTFNLTDPTQLGAALQDLNDRITQLSSAAEHLTAQNQALPIKNGPLPENRKSRRLLFQTNSMERVLTTAVLPIN
jgi:hypothetical protein